MDDIDTSNRNAKTDLEKEGSNNRIEFPQEHDAEIEKRVVRKLDWNVTTLVMVLCECLKVSCSTK
jgi:hypothetical protein